MKANNGVKKTKSINLLGYNITKDKTKEGGIKQKSLKIERNNPYNSMSIQKSKTKSSKNSLMSDKSKDTNVSYGFLGGSKKEFNVKKNKVGGKVTREVQKKTYKSK